MAIGSSSNAMTKGLKVAFDHRDGGETASCSSTEMTEMPEANVSLQALPALSRHSPYPYLQPGKCTTIALAPAPALALTATVSLQALSALELCAQAFEDLEAEDVGTRVGAVNELARIIECSYGDEAEAVGAYVRESGGLEQLLECLGAAGTVEASGPCGSMGSAAGCVGLRSSLELFPLCATGMAWECSPQTSGRRCHATASHTAALPDHAGDPEPELHQKALMVPPACGPAKSLTLNPRPDARPPLHPNQVLGNLLSDAVDPHSWRTKKMLCEEDEAETEASGVPKCAVLIYHLVAHLESPMWPTQATTVVVMALVVVVVVVVVTVSQQATRQSCVACWA